MSESQTARRVENVAPVAGRAASLNIASDEFRLISEALENLGRCHSATPWEEDLILMIRNIGRAVDADRESFVKNLIDHGFMYDRNWIRVRTMLVFTTWILYDTTRGAWEGWSANEMWEECKRQMIRYKSETKSPAGPCCKMCIQCDKQMWSDILTYSRSLPGRPQDPTFAPPPPWSQDLLVTFK
ncbi:unnamed protein product [Penicillium manginii]